MTVGWGVDATLDGNGVPTSGTDDTDVRKVWGALYTPGIISGCKVTTSATAMTYSVAPGVVAIKTANGEVVMAPVEAETIPTAAAPATGSRVDIVYITQRFPDVEGDSYVRVGVGTTLPARSVAIQRYTVAAGNTNTNGALKTGGIDYSIPYGASLGILHQHRNTDNSWYTAKDTFGTATIYLPTDRLLRVSILTAASAAGAVGFDNSKYCEAAFDFRLDGSKKWRWNTTALTQAWAHFYWSDTIAVTAGSHIVSYERYRVAGSGTPWHHYVAGDMPGTLFTVEDVGPIV